MHVESREIEIESKERLLLLLIRYNACYVCRRMCKCLCILNITTNSMFKTFPFPQVTSVFVRTFVYVSIYFYICI